MKFESVIIRARNYHSGEVTYEVQLAFDNDRQVGFSVSKGESVVDVADRFISVLGRLANEYQLSIAEQVAEPMAKIIDINIARERAKRGNPRD